MNKTNLLLALPFAGYALFLVSLPFSVLIASTFFLLSVLVSLYSVFTLFYKPGVHSQ